TAYILLDGSDVPIQHLVLGCEASEVRMGMRVRAVWNPEEGRPASMKAIAHFEPTGDPDADPATYSKHL
ncbi:MAG: DNA-binding protein, partial [Dietzia sp.]|nr:DNA-binding protein [Dietzia sp.]